MNVIQTALPGVVILEPKVFGDSRGWFYESYHQSRFAEAGIDADLRQSNVSRSAHGVLRGLHYQWPRPQGKLVSVLVGEVYDVAVDIRQGSPTFGRWVSAMLTAENHRQMWIPEGFAHGFAVVSDEAIFSYHCTEVYDPAADASIRFDDAAFGIDWPVSEPLLSEKDARAPMLAYVLPDRLPIFQA